MGLVLVRVNYQREIGTGGSPARTVVIFKNDNTKVLLKLFQKLAESRGRASGRSPQRAKHFIEQPAG